MDQGALMFKSSTLIVAAGPCGQDRAEIIQHPQGVVLVVADGAGGTSGGDEAADTVITWVRAFANRTTDIFEFKQWGALLTRIDQQIAATNGQSTAVVASVTPSGIVGASVGDSAAWLVNDSTIDDLTLRQSRKPLLGTGEACPVCFERSAFHGTLLLASDGLIKYAPRDRIAEAAVSGEMESASQSLVDSARMRSGGLQDDVAVILCRSE